MAAPECRRIVAPLPPWTGWESRTGAITEAHAVSLDSDLAGCVEHVFGAISFPGAKPGDPVEAPSRSASRSACVARESAHPNRVVPRPRRTDESTIVRTAKQPAGHGGPTP